MRIFKDMWIFLISDEHWQLIKVYFANQIIIFNFNSGMRTTIDLDFKKESSLFKIEREIQKEISYGNKYLTSS